VRQEDLQPNQGKAEARVRRDDQKRGRPAEPLDPGEDDALSREHDQPESERDPDRGVRRHGAKDSEQERGERWNRRLHERGLTAGDETQLGERHALVVRHAVRQRVRVDVRDPED
jgi:hypothetical protein